MNNNNVIENETLLLESVSEDTLKQILKEYKFYSRDQLLSVLKLITPKNQSLYLLTQDTSISSHLTDQDLRSLVYRETKKQLKTLTKLKRKYASNIDKKDYLHMRKPIDRDSLPIGHPLRNKHTPLPLRRAPNWLYAIDSSPNTRNSYLQIKDLMALSFIEHNRIMVVRMDLYVSDKDKQNLDKVNWYFNRLLSNTLYRMDYYLDYICSKEYTEESGVHLHCLFLLDGNKIKREVEFVLLVGVSWDRMIGKKHSWYSANLHKGKYPDLAPCLGLIEYHEFFKIERLIQYCKYFLKSLNDREWLERLGLNPRSRLFTMSFTSDRLYQIDENNERFKEEIGNNRRFYCSYDWIYHIRLTTTDTVFKSLLGLKGNRKQIDITRYIKENKSFNGKERDLVLVEENGLYYSR